MLALKIIAVVIGGYLFGNINTAVVISKLKGRDIRKLGSGNPGTMNMLRNFGIFWGLMTLAGDALKGVVPALLGWWVLGEPWTLGPDKLGAYIAGVSVITGHIFPVFFKFKGGKGIASTIGVCLVISPIAALIAFAVGAVFLIFTHLGAVTSFIMISVPLIAEAVRLGGQSVAGSCLLFALFALTLFAHRSNIRKLMTGKERPVILFGKKKRAARAERHI